MTIVSFRVAFEFWPRLSNEVNLFFAVNQVPQLCAQHLNELKGVLKDLTSDTEELIQTYMCMRKSFAFGAACGYKHLRLHKTAVIDYADKSNNPDLGDLSLPRLRSALVFRREFLIYLDALRVRQQRDVNALIQF